MNPVFEEILQIISIEWMVINTPMEPQLGEPGNQGLKYARIRGIVCRINTPSRLGTAPYGADTASFSGVI